MKWWSRLEPWIEQQNVVVERGWVTILSIIISLCIGLFALICLPLMLPLLIPVWLIGRTSWSQRWMKCLEAWWQ